MFRKENKSLPKIVILVFVLQVILNWAYVLWVRQQFDIITNSWFALTPMFTYLYLFFSFFAAIGLHYRARLALGLSYWVILFGTIASVLSYELGFKSNPMIEIIITPLIILNLGVLIFIAVNKSYFTKN